MTMGDSSAGLSLADFLYSRLAPLGKHKLEPDYHRHNPAHHHHHQAHNPPTLKARQPKFIVSDVRAGFQTKGKQVSRAVSSFRQALNNIVDIKESLFRTLLPPTLPSKRPHEVVGTGEGSEDIAFVDGSDWEQFKSGNNYFRPSLTDPLRPTVKILGSMGGGGVVGSTPPQFLPPRETTKIDTAVVGEPVKARRPANVGMKTETYSGGNLSPVQPPVEKIKGRLKVPEERTPIDTAVFAEKIFQNKPLQVIRTFQPILSGQTETGTSDSYQVSLGGDTSKEFVRV